MKSLLSLISIIIIFSIMPCWCETDSTDPFENVEKVLVVGNSLSRHAPLPKEGWTGNWGMAATAKDKDYVHVILRELDKRYPQHKHTAKIIRPKNEAQMSGYDEILSEKADLVIVQIGENYRGKDIAPNYEKMLLAFRENITPNIICVGTWALESPATGPVPMELVARKLGIPYVNIRGLAVLANSAYRDHSFDKAGDPVRWHPSDKGMEAIAKLILKTRIKKLAPTAKAKVTVDATKTAGKTNLKVFGHFVLGADGQYIWGYDTPNWNIRKTGEGAWNAEEEKPNAKVVELMKALRPGVLRYPGGSSAKNYNWKLLVGPLAERQEGWHWGLVEYLTFCREVGAEPQICLSEYVGGPEDQRDLVEFLNAPATPDHPWAVKRSEWGHPEPFGVKYFELGNEPYDGNRDVKPRKQWDAAGYTNWAKTTAKLMKSVDPTIKLGVPHGGFGEEADDQIIKEVAPFVDFIVIHSYSVVYAGNRDLSSEEENLIMRACLVAANQKAFLFQKRRRHILELTGKDMPMALTEYNTLLQQSVPRPYRKSLAAGMFSVENALNMLPPKRNFLLANYWQMINGYWGSIMTGENYRLHPPYYCYRIVAQNLGDELLLSSVACPRIEFEGFSRVSPAKGTRYTPRKTVNKNLYSEKLVFLPKEGMKYPGMDVKKIGDEIRFTMKNYTGAGYPSFAAMPTSLFAEKFRPEAGVAYELSFEGRFIAEPGSAKLNMGLGMMDARGWEAAGSAIGVEGIDSPRWQKLSATYTPLKDTKKMMLLGRLLAGTEPVTGELRIRNIQVRPVQPECFPAFPCLTVQATKTDSSVNLVIINKYMDRKVDCEVDLQNFSAKDAGVSVLTAPEPAAISGASISEEIKTPVQDNKITLCLEPCSITAIKVHGTHNN